MLLGDAAEAKYDAFFNAGDYWETGRETGCSYIIFFIKVLVALNNHVFFTVLGWLLKLSCVTLFKPNFVKIQVL